MLSAAVSAVHSTYSSSISGGSSDSLNSSSLLWDSCVLRLAFLNSHYQSGLRNHLDAAVLAEGAARQLPSSLKLDLHVTKVDELPFDFERRRMSVLVQCLIQGETRHVLVCKGAVEEVAAVCTNVRRNASEPVAAAVAAAAGGSSSISPAGSINLCASADPLSDAVDRAVRSDSSELEVLAHLLHDAEAALPLHEAMPHAIAHTRKLNEVGYRCLAVAYRVLERVPVNAASGSSSAVDALSLSASVAPAAHLGLECDLTLAGFLTFLDPPKESTRGALDVLRGQGIAIKVLTGDNDSIARNVCSQVGVDTSRVVLGPELDSLSDVQVGELAVAASVFAKLTPFHKERLVRCMQERGHVVGFLGDGINGQNSGQRHAARAQRHHARAAAASVSDFVRCSLLIVVRRRCPSCCRLWHFR